MEGNNNSFLLLLPSFTSNPSNVRNVQSKKNDLCFVLVVSTVLWCCVVCVGPTGMIFKNMFARLQVFGFSILGWPNMNQLGHVILCEH